jgi:hypothetical protein
MTKDEDEDKGRTKGKRGEYKKKRDTMTKKKVTTYLVSLP